MISYKRMMTFVPLNAYEETCSASGKFPAPVNFKSRE